MVIRFPLWTETAQPLDGIHRQWCVGSIDAADWHATAQALDLAPDWHASLISVAGQSYWLTSDGHWLHEKHDVTVIIERRLEGTQALLKALVAPPSRFAQRCVDAAEYVLRR